MNVKSAIHEFILDGDIGGKATTTSEWYQNLLGRFAKLHGEKDIKEVDAPLLRAYLAEIKRSYTSTSTRSGHNRALHTFWHWVSVEYNINDPMRNIPRPPKPKIEGKAAEPEDIQAMFAATRPDETGIRDRFILAFLLDTGCRSQGLRELEMRNIDTDERYAILTEKGSKTRSVVFSSHCRDLLLEWIAVREEAVPTVIYNINTLEPLTRSGLYRVLARLARKAGVKKNFSPHAFRHAFTIGYIRNGGDVVSCSNILGHNDISTTVKHYALMTNSEIKKAHDEYSPVKNLLAAKAQDSK